LEASNVESFLSRERSCNFGWVQVRSRSSRLFFLWFLRLFDFGFFLWLLNLFRGLFFNRFLCLGSACAQHQAQYNDKT
jgi:hypothetical protein